jgi:hypothetical protein
MDFTSLFPEHVAPNTGPGVSYCIALNARMFDYELLLPGERRMRGCLRAVDKDDAQRILLNRHPHASIIELGGGRRIQAKAEKA